MKDAQLAPPSLIIPCAMYLPNKMVAKKAFNVLRILLSKWEVVFTKPPQENVIPFPAQRLTMIHGARTLPKQCASPKDLKAQNKTRI